jgi:hypothetical protein
MMLENVNTSQNLTRLQKMQSNNRKGNKQRFR